MRARSRFGSLQAHDHEPKLKNEAGLTEKSPNEHRIRNHDFNRIFEGSGLDRGKSVKFTDRRELDLRVFAMDNDFCNWKCCEIAF